MSNQQGSPKTPQEVIKSFMASLANHGYEGSTDSLGTAMVDSAIRKSSRFANAQEVIDAMLADQVLAEKAAVVSILGEEYTGKTLADLAETNSDLLKEDAKKYQSYLAAGTYTVEQIIQT